MKLPQRGLSIFFLFGFFFPNVLNVYFFCQTFFRCWIVFISIYGLLFKDGTVRINATASVQII